MKEKYIGTLENLFGDKTYLYTYADSIDRAKKNLEYQKSQKGELGMFYTNVSDYETKEDMMNDFIALRMYDMAKDKEIERLTDLCNKYEEEHKTTYEIWKKDIARINKAIEELENIPINANGGDILESERKIYHILKGK